MNYKLRHIFTKILIKITFLVKILQKKVMARLSVKIHLSKILGEKRMTQAELAKKTGIRAGTINDWYHEIIPRLNVEHLDRICEVLECNISDLLEYIPNKNKKTGKHLILEEHGNRKEKGAE